jgi:hypothetical protein
MNARFAKRFSLQPVQLLANEHGLLRLNLRNRPLRLPVELPPNASWKQVLKVQAERLVDYFFGT